MARTPVTPTAPPQGIGSGRIHAHGERNFTGVHAHQATTWAPGTEALQLWKSLAVEDPVDTRSLQKSFCRHAVKTLARGVYNMDDFAAYQALAYSVRDRLLDEWNLTQNYYTQQDRKRVYYLSLEFLLGRSLDNAMLNLCLKDSYKDAIGGLGFRMEDLIQQEVDAALGNGGLGRLAACYMDSMATLNLPAWGYGLRYTYGIFQQRIVDGYQTEFPDYWLNFGNAWEIQRLDVSYEVRFRGTVTKVPDESGTSHRCVWEGGEKVMAIAYDYPVPGYNTRNTINIRLWSSKPKREFDFASFNAGNYDKAVEEQKQAENISSVLYPNDNHMVGKILRLKQQYFFVCATLQDIIRRFKKSGRAWSEFSSQVSIQLNDTHPTLGIPELMRILVDDEGLQWDEAWGIVTRTFSFTNHTVLPEALEKWSVPLLQELLPRHLQIIFDINLYFLQAVERQFPGDRDRLRRMSIIEEGQPQLIRMASLAIVGSHTVNGVAALHSALLKTTIFRDYVEYFGTQKFINITNGITPRRWLLQANPRLAALIAKRLGGPEFLTDLDQLKRLLEHQGDRALQQEWMAIKRENKVRLAKYVRQVCGIEVNPDALFDVQCKRLHEYKRQFMNILGVIHKYNELRAMTPEQQAAQVPRVVIFSGKSAPGYYMAKLVIKLINSVADRVNKDADIRDKLKVVFIPNYNVSLAEIIIPASDVSQHISTAGTEASGTSNMKFVLNGGLILGTVDGANIEIAEEIKDDNIWLFGTLADKVDDIRHDQRYRRLTMDPQLQAVLDCVNAGTFGEPKTFEPLVATITVNGDYYLISKDFGPYLETQTKVEAAFKDASGWAARSIRACAGMGKFSSDRSIQEYADSIWHVQSLKVPPKEQPK